ncbi:cytochrome c [Lentibacillus sp. CBA3610]|uniref:c-type cytochrome n=1 Tax=Lentibacillus sp. CBA3610 TaxID=2518176 RepID=UPI00159634BF|nr:cytochrome c [Lentibacillus sp. CBA3610]QKY69478.1 cytochrome c [Lentibacillus sp. CBA3610]
MKNPVIPYALIAGIGILLVIVVSVVGLDQQEAIQEEGNGEEQGEQQEGGSGDGGESGGGETAANGEEVYQSNCASCHGQDLSGQSGPALDTVGSKYSQEEIEQIIADGFPDAGMPPGLVQGEDAQAVAQWLSEQQ